MDPIFRKEIEREAIARCQQGDREAFRRVLDFHGDHLYRVALLITRNASLAEEALLAAWKKIRSFDIKRDFRPWINRILINCIWDYAAQETATNSGRRRRLSTA